MGKRKKILWAIDPFSKLKESNLRAIETLTQLAKEGPISVEPIYVLGSESLNWVGHVAEPNVNKFIPVAKDAMAKVLDQFGDSSFLPPKILINKKASRRADVKVLNSYAKKVDASLILLSTHARTGVDRIFLGSFAETVLLYSKTPMLFVTPHTRVIKGFKKILFPSNLSKGSKEAYQNILKHFKGAGKLVEILNIIIHPIDAFVQSGVGLAGGGWVSIENYLTIQEESKKKTGAQWTKWAEKRGFESSFNLSREPGRLGDAIVDRAKASGADLIAMGTESGPVASLLIGNVAREVIRFSDVPVWVTHYNSK